MFGFFKRVFMAVVREVSQGHTPGTGAAAVSELMDARARVDYQAVLLADDLQDAVSARYAAIDRLDSEIDSLEDLLGQV